MALEPTIVGIATTENAPKVTALACHPSGEYIMCGKENGVVAIYSTANGKEVQLLYQHARGIAISILHYGTKLEALASADTSSRFMIWKIMKNGSMWIAEGPVLDARVPDYPIGQLLFDPNNNRILVSTLVSDTIYDMTSGDHNTVNCQERSSWRWINQPSHPNKLIYITPEAVYIRTWDDLPGLSLSAEMTLVLDDSSNMCVRDVVTSFDGCEFAVQLSKPHNHRSDSSVFVLSASMLEKSLTETIASPPQPVPTYLQIGHLVGIYRKKLLFLDRRMWVCSFDLGTSGGDYVQHCFVPDEWLSVNTTLIIKVTTKGDLIFIKGHEIAVIKKALDHQEVVVVDKFGKDGS